MSDTRILLVVGIIAIVVGAVLNVHSLMELPEAALRAREKASHLKALRELEKEAIRERAMIAELDTRRDRSSAGLREIASQTIPDTTFDVRERDPLPVVDGWTLRQADVTFNDFALKRVAPFIIRAESGDLPWRLTACTVRANQAAGRGQITLTFELLEPGSPGSG